MKQTTPFSTPRAIAATLFLPAMLIASLAVPACTETGDDADRGIREAAAEVARTPVHVDSTFPVEEELRRFRAGLVEPAGLGNGSDSRGELVDTFLRRLEAGDTMGVAALAITPAEFAWFYYPHTMYVSRPYELPPSLVWYQLQNRSSRGMVRLLRRYAGKTLYDVGYSCPDEGETFGDGHIWHGCTVLGRIPSGERVEERLFGSILALDGHYKLVSFSNEL